MGGVVGGAEVGVVGGAEGGVVGGAEGGAGRGVVGIVREGVGEKHCDCYPHLTVPASTAAAPMAT